MDNDRDQQADNAYGIPAMSPDEKAYALHHMFPDQYPAVPKPAWLKAQSHAENTLDTTQPVAPEAKPKPVVYKKLKRTVDIFSYTRP